MAHPCTLALIAFIFSILAINSAAASDSAQSACFDQLRVEQARIERVSDGDTLVLSDQRRVRLIGINTAELNARNKQLRAAAQTATDVLSSLLPAGEVVNLYIGDESHDRHGRVLAHVVRQRDGLAVATALLQQGMALQSAVAPNTRCAREFAEAERVAERADTGQWNNLRQYHKRASDLSGAERGFWLVSGRVSKINKHKRYTEVYLDGNLRLLIRPKLAAQLQPARLQNKTIEVRGWLNNRNKKALLWLQHESNLRELDRE